MTSPTYFGEISALLKILQAHKQPLIRMEYAQYRRRFSVTAVPIVKSIPAPAENSRKPVPFIVWVEKEKAIEFLKTHNNFLSRRELERELHDASSDFSRVVERE